MTDSLFEAVALCSKELMKYSLSAEEFAVLAQKNGMTDSEILAVSKTFEYLRDKKKRESVEFLLRTSRLPLKAPKTFDNFDFNRITGKNVEKLRSLSTLWSDTLKPHTQGDIIKHRKGAADGTKIHGRI